MEQTIKFTLFSALSPIRFLPRRPAECFRVTHYLRLQCQIVNQAIIPQESGQWSLASD
jgi:hypothetical protein